MKVIKERVSGDVMVLEDTLLQGIVTGKVCVARGANLMHHGMIVGPVTLEPGAEASIFGFVKGDVVNKGGDLRVYGTVNGAVKTEAGSTRIDKDAFIRQEENLTH